MISPTTRRCAVLASLALALPVAGCGSDSTVSTVPSQTSTAVPTPLKPETSTAPTTSSTASQSSSTTQSTSTSTGSTTSTTSSTEHSTSTGTTTGNDERDTAKHDTKPESGSPASHFERHCRGSGACD